MNPFYFLYFLAPFGVPGLYLIVKKILEKTLVKRGYVKVHLLKENFRKQTIWAKPQGGELRIRGKQYTFTNKPGFVIFNSDVPECYYNEKTGQQINVYAPTDSGKISAQLIDQLLKRAYNLGKLEAFQEFAKISKLVLIVVVVSLAVVGAVVFSWHDLGTMLKQVLTLLKSKGG